MNTLAEADKRGYTTETVAEPTRRAAVGEVLAGLHQLHQWIGRTIVVKYGGAALQREELRAAFARDIARLRAAGVRPVVVHGGGPEIDALLHRLGQTPHFVDGLRVTDAATREIATMVLVGQINPTLVGLINRHGGHAIGLCGNDADLIVARRRVHRRPGGETVDLGLVGEVERVNVAVLRMMEQHEVIPVIAPIATGSDGETYNVNADHVAAAVAAALHAAALLELTDVPGLLDRDGHLIPSVSRAELARLARQGAINGGMLPKTDAACHALEEGVSSARIVDGRRPHALVLSLLGRLGSGTEITA